MKRAVLVLLVLLGLAAAPLYAVRITSVDDVIRLHRAGMIPSDLLELVQRPHEPLDVTYDDVVAMRDAGVPREVIAAIVAEARRTAGDDDRATRVADVADSRTNDHETGEEDECITYDPPSGIPRFFWPPWLWDPHWFMPRLHSVVDEPAKKARTDERNEKSPAMASPVRPGVNAATAPGRSRPQPKEGSVAGRAGAAMEGGRFPGI